MRHINPNWPYQPLNRQAIRADVQADLVESARDILTAYNTQKSDMSREEYRLRIHYAHLELKRIAKFYNFYPSDFPVPEIKDIPV